MVNYIFKDQIVHACKMAEVHSTIDAENAKTAMKSKVIFMRPFLQPGGRITLSTPQCRRQRCEMK